MEPINLNYNGGPRKSTGNGFDKKRLITIIILLIIVICIRNMGDNEDYYEPQEYNSVPNNTTSVNSSSNVNPQQYEGYDFSSYYGKEDGSSYSLLDLFLGGSSSNGSNTNYASYEDANIKNVSKDKYTLMIYMCGSNLESDGGYASADIEEMLKSTLADEINVLIYTGGAKRWYDFGISSRTNQIYVIENHRLKLVRDNLGRENMASAKTLSDFLKFGKQNYPADHYALIMWDHGGGAVSGFGLDENASKSDNLTIDEIKEAVDSFGTKLEFVGFDACLMANMETAYALKDSAKYLIASEETEPGTGWNYIKLFNELSKDSSQSGATTGKTIVDSFIASNSSYRNPDATLSVMDLSKIENVYASLVSFMKEIKKDSFDKNKFNTFSKTVANSKAFGEGKIDTIDLMDFATKMNLSSSSSLVNAVNSAVSYNKTNQYVQNSNGMSVYIPNRNLDNYEKMLNIYKKIGMGNDYTSVLTQYVNAIAGGRQHSYTVNNHSYSQSSSNYSDFSWFDLLLSTRSMQLYEESKINVEELKVEDKGEYYSLHLSESDWENIVKVESVAWYDIGNGYLDMGADSYYTKDEEGDLKVEFDGTWLAISGDNIHYEVVERTDDYEKGLVPCLVNKERVNLVLYFDKENPDGEILGYEPDYDEVEEALFERGLRKLKTGDKIDFIAPFYSYEGEIEDEFIINDSLEIGNEPLKISYESLGDEECLIYYKLTDVFGNIYYTEPVIVY